MIDKTCLCVVHERRADAKMLQVGSHTLGDSAELVASYVPHIHSKTVELRKAQVHNFAKAGGIRVNLCHAIGEAYSSRKAVFERDIR